MKHMQALMYFYSYTKPRLQHPALYYQHTVYLNPTFKDKGGVILSHSVYQHTYFYVNV